MSKEAKPDRSESAGRFTFDDRGNTTWEWRTDTGTFSREIDTARVRALQEAAGVKLDEPAAAPEGANPYSTANSPKIAEKKEQRRTLDDMRKLSEEIKRAREKSSK